MFLRFIDAVSSCSTFIFIALKVFHLMNIPRLIYAFTIDGNLDCFQVLANANNAFMNFLVHVSWAASVQS